MFMKEVPLEANDENIGDGENIVSKGFVGMTNRSMRGKGIGDGADRSIKVYNNHGSPTGGKTVRFAWYVIVKWTMQTEITLPDHMRVSSYGSVLCTGAVKVSYKGRKWIVDYMHTGPPLLSEIHNAELGCSVISSRS